MHSDDTTPVLVGASQQLARDVDPADAPEPLETLESVARAAAEDAGLTASALAELDRVALIDVAGWHPQNAPGLLAEALGAKPAREYVSAIGGEMPITVLGRIADEIRRGAADRALIASCHNVRTLRTARKAGIRLAWKRGGRGEPELVGENRPGSSDLEVAYGLRMPTELYPLLETALRARRGLTPAAHIERVGRLMSRFTEVAAKNPYAWFPTARSPEELVTPGPVNRMIAYPYTKYLNAVIETDQSAALLMMSARAARAAGIPSERQVTWQGWANTEVRAWNVSERDDLSRCPALREAVHGALARAGTRLEDIAHIDFYSCFPVAVEMACDMLGLDEADPRGFTVTGGLPYAGGPASGYTVHAMAAMFACLRGTERLGLVTGNGWYLTKHSAVVLAGVPCGDVSEVEVPLRVGSEPITVVEVATGAATLEGYTVLYDRDGAPVRGIGIGRTRAGERFVANTPEDRDVLEHLVAVEAVGLPGQVHHEGGANVFEP